MDIYGYGDYCVNSNFHCSVYMVFKFGLHFIIPHWDHAFFRSVNNVFHLAIASVWDLWKISFNM